MKNPQLIKIYSYVTKGGKQPFNQWRSSLDKSILASISIRINRIRLGNFGDSKIIKGGDGIRELRIDVGPGYRVYFGMHGKLVVILLIGGDKKTQNRDIQKAKEYWFECKKELLWHEEKD